MKVSIDSNTCAGCGMCEAITGGTISVDQTTGKAKLNPEADLNDPAVAESVKMAAQACPSQAIIITEIDG